MRRLTEEEQQGPALLLGETSRVLQERLGKPVPLRVHDVHPQEADRLEAMAAVEDHQFSDDQRSASARRSWSASSGGRTK